MQKKKKLVTQTLAGNNPKLCFAHLLTKFQ